MVLLYDELRAPRPHHLGSEYGYCRHCKCNVRGVLHDSGYEYGNQLDNVCGIHGDALQPAREEEQESM